LKRRSKIGHPGYVIQRNELAAHGEEFLAVRNPHHLNAPGANARIAFVVCR